LSTLCERQDSNIAQRSMARGDHQLESPLDLEVDRTLTTSEDEQMF
jgi:hypothetical protein